MYCVLWKHYELQYVYRYYYIISKIVYHEILRRLADYFTITLNYVCSNRSVISKIVGIGLYKYWYILCLRDRKLLCGNICATY